ncbi:D-2-hydroxyacid dehydrogenase [Oceanispirochaeta crateris]|uniref:D-2-hydroxyacid dehydrogenase n=1 Tax=Oceanispirochaeta crateris TaxID=2518645 RepID=A0A5C1QR49_9SPIO|nr:D-2-hydroxyacid dehydrogenase [Oceanispirochaeta crateris]QEN09440.1 D-2-hydroxyacid dehydrogenase [Oceanispirochaeta crateris]
MIDIHSVLIAVSFDEKYMQQIRDIYTPAKIIELNFDDEKGIVEALKSVDVAFIGGDLDDRYINAPKLQWVHCGHAGLNKFAKKEIFDKGLVVSSSAGRSAPALAEHIILFMLALSYKISDFIEAQKTHTWGIKGQSNLRALYGQTIGIIGMGHTGKELAVRTKAMGMKVIAYSNKEKAPENVDSYYSAAKEDTLDDILKESDFLALCIPLTDKTYHMISTKELKMMKPSSCIINMARGAVIDESVLIKALKEGWIAGAGLDTFEQEPLSSKSELWDLPNVYMTPHCTPQVPDRTGRTIEILKENVLRYRKGLPLLNQLMIHDIFSR